MDIIAEGKVSAAGYDKTIQATIVSCINAIKGQYKIKYQGNTFYAYSNNLDYQYTKGTTVYVLVPGNDFTQMKTILGTVGNVGAVSTDTTYMPIEYKYETWGIDYIDDNVTNQPIGLRSYKRSSIVRDKQSLQWVCRIYKKNGVTDFLLTPNEEKLSVITSFNESEFLYDIKQSRRYCLKVKLNTTIPAQQTQGEYGICFEYELADGTKILKWFSSNKIAGNPLRFVLPINHTWYEEIGETDIVGVNAIYVYTADFLYVEQDHVRKYGKLPSNDIFISDLDLEAATKLSNEEITTSHLVLTAPHRQFTIGQTEITVTAELRKGGKVQNLTGGNYTYYWYIERPDVIFDGIEVDDAARIGGEGWYNVGKTTVNNFVYSKTLCPSNRITIKCVLVYDTTDENNKAISLQYDKEMILRNVDCDYDQSLFNLEYSADQSTWVSGEAYNFIDSSDTIYIHGFMNSGNYSTKWFSRNRVYDYTSVNTMMINGKPAIQVNGQDINQNDINTYFCCYYINNNYIGYKIFNCTFGTNEAAKYEIIFKNSELIYYYNEAGIAVTETPQGNKAAILPITYTMIEIEHPENVISAEQCETTWMVTANNNDRLIDLTDYVKDGQREAVINFNGADYWYAVGSEASYTLKPNYNINAQNNQILVQIKYKNEIMYATTQLYCYKIGDPNVQNYGQYCDIVAEYDRGANPQYTKFNIMYIKPREGGAPGYTYHLNNNDSVNYNRLIFRIQNPETGALEIKDTGVTWDVVLDPPPEKEQEEKYPPQDLYKMRQLRIAADGQLSGINEDIVDFPYAMGLIKGVYTSDTNTVYTNITPIGSCTSIYLSYVEGSGFSFIKYGSNSDKPIYDSNSPFKILIDKNIPDIDILNAQFGDEGDWGCECRTHSMAWNLSNGQWVDTGLLKVKDRSVVYDVDTQTVSCTVEVKTVSVRQYTKDNFFLECKLWKKDNTQPNNRRYLATISFPIDVYIIPNDNTTINGWDGHSLSMSPEGAEQSYLMASMLGAGHKENDETFTGVVIGDVMTYASDRKADNLSTGIFGYGKGRKTFFVDANTGKTVIGDPAEGAITIVPSQNGTTSKIESSGYQRKDIQYTFLLKNDKPVYKIKGDTKTEGTVVDTSVEGYPSKEGFELLKEINSETYFYRPLGLEENQVYAAIASITSDVQGAGLSLNFGKNPEIIFGNENFSVDTDGKLTTNKAKICGDFIAGDQPDIRNKTADVMQAIMDSGIGKKGVSRVDIKQVGDFTLKSVKGSGQASHQYEIVNVEDAVNPETGEEYFKTDREDVTNAPKYKIAEYSDKGFKVGEYTCGTNELVDGIEYKDGRLKLRGTATITDATIVGNFSAGDYETYGAALSGDTDDPKYSKSASYVSIRSKGDFTLQSVKNGKVSGSYIGTDNDGNSVVVDVEDVDGYHKASINGSGFSFGKYGRGLAEDGINKSDILLNGISYSNGNLTISGKITATSGSIGGWTVTSKSIKSPGGGLILYSDGRISGYDGNKNGGKVGCDWLDTENRRLVWKATDGMNRTWDPATGSYIEEAHRSEVASITSVDGGTLTLKGNSDVEINSGEGKSIKLNSGNKGTIATGGTTTHNGVGVPSIELVSSGNAIGDKAIGNVKLLTLTGIQESINTNVSDLESGIIGIYSTYAAYAQDVSLQYSVLAYQAPDVVTSIAINDGSVPKKYTKEITPGESGIIIYVYEQTKKEDGTAGPKKLKFIKNPNSAQLAGYKDDYNQTDFDKMKNYFTDKASEQKSYYYNWSFEEQKKVIPKVSKVLGYAPDAVIRAVASITDQDKQIFEIEVGSQVDYSKLNKHTITERYNSALGEVLNNKRETFNLVWGIYSDKDTNEVKYLQAPDGHITTFTGFEEL